MIKFLKQRGFTDKLYSINFIACWIFVILGIICTFMQSSLGIIDMTVFSVGIPCAFGELSVHTGYIIWKAKNENISKYGNNTEE